MAEVHPFADGNGRTGRVMEALVPAIRPEHLVPGGALVLTGILTVSGFHAADGSVVPPSTGPVGRRTRDVVR